MQNLVMYENGVYESVSYSLILPWTHTCELIERPYFLGKSGIRVKIKSVLKYF